MTAPQAGAANTLGHAYYATGGIGCDGDVTYVDATSPTYDYVAPYDGVITTWSTYGFWTNMKLKVLRPGSGTRYTVVGGDGPRVNTFAALNTFDVRMPVRQGDAVGVYTPDDGLCPGNPNPGNTGILGVAGDPAIGSTTSFSNAGSGDAPIEATIERDQDGDGYGDETQDECPTNAAVQGRCPLPTTIGETFTPIPSNFCGGDTAVVTRSPGVVHAVPADGVITSWSYMAGTLVSGTVKLKLARPLGGDNYLIVGEDGPHAPTASTLNTFATRIPVRSGDKIGLTADGVGCASNASNWGLGFVTGDVAPATSGTFTQSTSRKLDVSAVVEPDADGDGYGDTSQDLCQTDASTQGPCPIVGPPPPSEKSSECLAAERKLEKARAKLRRLKKNDAKAKKLDGAAEKVKKARKAAKKAC